MTKKRFRKNEVRALLIEDGFAIRRLSYWTTLLFPLAVIARTLGGSKTGRDFDSDKKSFTHRLFAQTMKIELGFMKVVSFPFGVAIFAVARKDWNKNSRNI